MEETPLTKIFDENPLILEEEPLILDTAHNENKIKKEKKSKNNNLRVSPSARKIASEKN